MHALNLQPEGAATNGLIKFYLVGAGKNSLLKIEGNLSKTIAESHVRIVWVSVEKDFPYGKKRLIFNGNNHEIIR